MSDAQSDRLVFAAGEIVPIELPSFGSRLGHETLVKIFLVETGTDGGHDHIR